jgi:hypothetical protein
VFLVPIVKVVMLGKGLESECEEEKGMCVEEHRQGGWGRSTRYCAENRLKVKRNVSPEMLSHRTSKGRRAGLLLVSDSWQARYGKSRLLGSISSRIADISTAFTAFTGALAVSKR